MDPQREIINFLSNPNNHGPDVHQVERLDTHGAYVFLAGEFAFKIKRAVRYPYLDFSTLEKREWVCRREVTLNRRTASKLYLGTVAIVRDADGALSIGGVGEVVEWAVKMRRFPQEALFDCMASEGGISFDLCRDLARKIAAFHQSAKVSKRIASDLGRSDQQTIKEGNISDFRARPDIFQQAKVRALDQALRTLLRTQGGLLDQQYTDGFVRHCHGDLYLRNMRSSPETGQSLRL